jgi:hypothetical protein
MTNTLPQIPADSPDWFETVRVKFDGNTFGVVPLDISASPDFRPVTVYISEITNPFPDMVAWLEQIADNNVPATWFVQGETATLADHYLQVSSLPDDRLDFIITTGSVPEENGSSLLHVTVKRKQLVNQFVQAFKTFLKKDYRQEHWSMTSDLRRMDISQVLLKLREKV